MALHCQHNFNFKSVLQSVFQEYQQLCTGKGIKMSMLMTLLKLSASNGSTSN